MMKKLNRVKIFGLASIATLSMAFMTGCGDSNEPTDTTGPTSSVTSENGNTADDAYSIESNQSSDDKDATADSFTEDTADDNTDNKTNDSTNGSTNDSSDDSEDTAE